MYALGFNKNMSNKKGEEHYVDQADFENQLRMYYETDVMTEDLGVIIRNIAIGLSHNHRFIRYTSMWKDEMMGDAVEKMYKALEKKLYKFDKGFNPFSYFNQIAWHAFCNRIKKEQKQHKGLAEYKDLVYMEEMTGPESQGHIYVKPIMEGDEYDDE